MWLEIFKTENEIVEAFKIPSLGVIVRNKIKTSSIKSDFDNFQLLFVPGATIKMVNNKPVLIAMNKEL